MAFRVLTSVLPMDTNALGVSLPMPGWRLLTNATLHFLLQLGQFRDFTSQLFPLCLFQDQILFFLMLGGLWPQS